MSEPVRNPDGLDPRTKEIRPKPADARAARDFLNFAIDQGYLATWGHGADSGGEGAPWVTVTAGNRDVEVHVTWHTRDTGTFRLFSCIARNPGRWHDLSFKAAKALLLDGAR